MSIAYSPPSGLVPTGSISSGEIEDGSVTLTDLNTATKADWEYAYSSYKTIRSVQSHIDAGATAGTYQFLQNGGNMVLFSAGNALGNFIYFDPADWAAGSRTAKLRVVAACQTNAAAPNITFTLGLYPVTSGGGGAGVAVMTAGTVTVGSTVVFTTPTLSTLTTANSGDFTAPAAGWFSLGCVTNGTAAANSVAVLSASLQMRQV